MEEKVTNKVEGQREAKSSKNSTNLKKYNRSQGQ